MGYDPKQNQIPGWMDDRELEWLYSQACHMGSIVEVGSWMGRSAHALLSGCNGRVTCIDHFKGSPGERETTHKTAAERSIIPDFIGNVGAFQNLDVMIMDSRRAASMFGDRSVDMIFIDACHDYEEARRDLFAWLPKCSRLLCGHDLRQGGVERAVQDLHLPYRNIEGTTLWEIVLG